MVEKNGQLLVPFRQEALTKSLLLQCDTHFPHLGLPNGDDQEHGQEEVSKAGRTIPQQWANQAA